MPSDANSAASDAGGETQCRLSRRWRRVLSLAVGVALTVAYLRSDLFAVAPDWAASAVSVVPVGFLLYGVFGRARRVAFVTVGVAVGTLLGTYLDSAGGVLP